jgi:flavin-dependent dehydrogenase
VRTADAIVVGGGPAGSTCAWKLRQAGLDVLVLDRAAFPRTKLCAGWVTPEAMEDLELDPRDYPHSLMSFDRLRVHWKMLGASPPTTQYSIRRFEFDDFLLQRAGADLVEHKVRDIQREDGAFVVDNEFRSKYLVGAGGTACPVYRAFFSRRLRRDGGLQTATLEHEFRYDWNDPSCHLWFFDDGLPGYAWYVPKENGFINVGLGGIAIRLKQKDGHLREYWQRYVGKLKHHGLVRYDNYEPKGYSYYLRGKVESARDGDAFIVGDAVGLATRDMCEGIGPAVRSGLIAARSILSGEPYSLEDISKLSGSGYPSKLLERSFCG